MGSAIAVRKSWACCASVWKCSSRIVPFAEMWSGRRVWSFLSGNMVGRGGFGRESFRRLVGGLGEREGEREEEVLEMVDMGGVVR